MDNYSDGDAKTAQNIVHTSLQKVRKRPRYLETKLGQEGKYKPQAFPTMSNCNHGENSIFRSKDLSMQDIRRIHQIYYKEANLEAKRNFILQHVTILSVDRRRRGNESKGLVRTTFVLPKRRENEVENIRVCRGAVLHILQEKWDKLHRLCSKYLKEGRAPKETRGAHVRPKSTN